VPAALAAATARAATAFAAGQAAAAPVAALTQGVLKAMFLSKCKLAAALLLLTAALAVGCFAFRAAAAGEEPGKAASSRDGDKDKGDLEALRKENEQLKRDLQVIVDKVKALEAEVRDLKANAAGRDEVPFETGWDKPIDPDKDCKFVRESGGLTIEVPGKDHDLAIERPLMNSPRLLRDVEGDFVARVRVTGKFEPSFDSTTDQRIPFVGAGLVLIESDQTFIRLDRATLRSGDGLKAYASWELRQDGKWVRAGEATEKPLDEDKPTYLKLERKGDKLLASVSQDGKTWSELDPIEVTLPAKVKLGLLAGTTSSDPFKPHYDQFQLTGGKGAKRK
jgi:regulation of enolase protein 1 (concanavalin A-like superfamily)